MYTGGYKFFGDTKDSDYSDRNWYFENVSSHGSFYETRRIKIGNDVWLGRNVLITNGSNIGNGVTAGVIITKDVSDYTIVMGVPARVTHYRYSLEQIKELNKIAWWGWMDEEIRERFEDFYLPIDKSLGKYRKAV